jgi:hypothetical protein
MTIILNLGSSFPFHFLVTSQTSGSAWQWPVIIQKALRHKSVLNTMKYIHTLQVKDEDFEETVAITPEEIRQLGKGG